MEGIARPRFVTFSVTPDGVRFCCASIPEFAALAPGCNPSRLRRWAATGRGAYGEFELSSPEVRPTMQA